MATSLDEAKRQLCAEVDRRAERLVEATRAYLLAIEAAEGGPDAAGPHAP